MTWKDFGMKNIIITICFCLSAMLAAPLAAQAADPINLESLQDDGLSEQIIARFLALNLDGRRAAPQVDVKLLSRLGRYGGDDLAKAYLELDAKSAHLPSRDFSPEVVDQLMTNGVPPANLKEILLSEAGRFDAEPAPSAGETKEPPKKKAGKTIYAPPLPPLRTAESQVPEQPRAVAAPAPAPASQTEYSSHRRPQLAYQDLRPGQAADPGSRLPLPYSTYDIRHPRNKGPWMGVTERELPDGHVVEVNVAGDSSLVGQEVISRPTGHKVYRYYSGRPDSPSSMVEDEQQLRRNREDLEIIFSDSKGRRY